MPEGDDGLHDRVPFLARLEPEDRTALLALGRELRFAAKVPLMQQHEPSTHVLVVLHGWTKVTATADDGYEALLALRGPGDLIGESAGLTGRPRSATVTALETVQAVAIERDRFMAYLEERGHVGVKLMGLIAERTRAADSRWVLFASMTTLERVAALLLDLARAHGRRVPDGIDLGVALSKQELAGAVAASREMLQRVLKDLRDRGVVTTGRRTVVILRPDILRRIARRERPSGGAGGAASGRW
ncbi:Crp/Fnr family transcriptional regulator [Streptomyces sp. NPDC002851]